MKSVFFILILLASFSSHAGNVVLLTSLSLSAGKTTKLEKRFHEAFDQSGMNVVIHHQVGPKRLMETLRSSETEGVFWVSHSASERELKTGLKANNMIADFDGNDVKNFFSTLTPRLKFLGIVGCQAGSILDGFKERGHFSENRSLEVMGFQKKVELFKGFKETLARAKVSLARPQVESEISEDDMTIPVVRSGTLNQGWLELGDKVVAFFETGETEKDMHISRSYWSSLKNKNLRLLRDLNSKDHFDMGNVSFHAPEYQWKLFANAQGKAIGNGHTQLYIFKGLTHK